MEELELEPKVLSTSKYLSSFKKEMEKDLFNIISITIL